MRTCLILIPVFNEAATIEAVVGRARRHGPVLVVDDGSSDQSAEGAARAGAQVIRTGRRRGKGAALREGFARALAGGAECVLTMDGDGQHDPDEIPRLLEAAAAAPDALVVGGRLGRLGEPGPGVIPPARRHAIRVAGFFIDWLTATPIVDTQSGFRVYPRGLLAALRPRRGGFVLESEMLIRAAAGGWPLREVPVRAIHSTARRSRFRAGRDGVAVACYLAGQVLLRWARELGGLAATLPAPFTGARRRLRHQELAVSTAPYRGSPAGLATAAGVFVLRRLGASWRDWWRAPHTRGLRLAAVASAVAPALLGLTLLQVLLHQAGVDLVAPVVGRVYSQERLAEALRAAGAERGRPAACAPA